MSNHNYICFRCRTAIRHSGWPRQTPRCLSCGEECFWLGTKVEVPRHSDIKAWSELEKECLRREKARNEEKALQKVRLKHFLEQEIQRLAQRPDNRDRNLQIRSLEKRLEGIAGGKKEA